MKLLMSRLQFPIKIIFSDNVKQMTGKHATERSANSSQNS